jgi:hypothetical protein
MRPQDHNVISKKNSPRLGLFFSPLAHKLAAKASIWANSRVSWLESTGKRR